MSSTTPTTKASSKKRRKDPFGQKQQPVMSRQRLLEFPAQTQTQTQPEKPIKIMSFNPLLIGGLSIRFPFKSPYPSQLQVISKLISCLKTCENGIFESPTGTGKSLSILLAAISWQNTKIQQARSIKTSADEALRYIPLSSHAHTHAHHVHVHGDPASSAPVPPRIPKIYFASRTHRQLLQMVLEMKRKTDLVPKMAIVGSREQLCIHSQVSTHANKNEECSKKIELSACSFFDNARILASTIRSEKAIFDIEDLVKAGNETGACPYYASKTLAEGADVIFTPYNYVIDPQTCPPEINLVGNVLIIDEAHNVEASATEAASIDLKETDLSFAVGDVATFGLATKNDVEEVRAMIIAFSKWLNLHRHDALPVEEYDKGMRLWSGKEAMEMLVQEGGLDPERIKQCKSDYEKFSSKSFSAKGGEDAKLKPSTKATISKLLMVLDFIFIKGYHLDYKLVLTKSKRSVRDNDPPSPPDLGLEFWCLNSGVIFREIGAKCHSVILTSGTLSPISSYALELGIPFAQTVEAPHVIGKHQLWAGVVPSSPAGDLLACTFHNLQQSHFQNELGRTILSLTCHIPKGCLVFLPSYSLLDRLVATWKQGAVWRDLERTKKVFVEPGTAAKRAGDVERLIARFDCAAATDGGALMFCVYRGKMSEGIDFADDKARGVICVGIPYPNVKSPKLKEAKEYHKRFAKEKNLMDGELWYKTQAFRALNQALGRCIRHQNDFGAVILLDSRFKAQPDTTKFLPKWLQKFLVVHGALDGVTASLQDFFRVAVAQDQERIEKEREPPAPPHDDAATGQQNESVPCNLDAKDDIIVDTSTKKGGERSSHDDVVQEKVPSITDENTPPPAAHYAYDVLVPESPEGKNGNTGSNDSPHTWSCANCLCFLTKSNQLDFVSGPSPSYPQTMLEEGELCDLGSLAEQGGEQRPASGFRVDERRIVCAIDQITYQTLFCVSCETMVGLYVLAVCPSEKHPRLFGFLGHVLLFSSKAVLDQESQESQRLDARSYGDEFSPVDWDALMCL